MEIDQRLASVRSTFILIARPTLPGKYWACKLPGLSRGHIAQATSQLRTDHAPSSKKLSDEPTLNTSALHKAFAEALGVGDQHKWRKTVDEDLPKFLLKHGLTIPTDLINSKSIGTKWMIHFGPREVADRIFNSRNPLPSRIYTGVNGKLFRFMVHNDFVRQLLDTMLGKNRLPYSSQQAVETIKRHGTEKAFSEKGSEHEFYDKTHDGEEVLISPDALLQLTWQNILLAGGPLHYDAGLLLDQHATRHRLLCDGVMGPLQEESAIHMGSSDVFSILRQALLDDNDGWVDVIPFNDHLCFLKGVAGQFDWVVRDQRDALLSINPLHPILDAKELPTEQRKSFPVWYFYQKGRSFYDDHLTAWEWQHKNGDLFKGVREPLDMIEQHLREEGIYRVVVRAQSTPTQKHKHPAFYNHRVGALPLQVSELITAEHFLDFLHEENWLEKRADRADKANKRLDSIDGQLLDTDLPAGVTYYDAIAYCGWLERHIGVPVRLLSAFEWASILPDQLKQRHIARLNNVSPSLGRVGMNSKLLREQRQAKRGKRPTNRVVGCEYMGELMDHEGLPGLDEATYKAVPVRFVRENVSWVKNKSGLPFLDGRGFGEWLKNYYDGHAPAVCAAYGRTMQDYELGTADHAIFSTYKHHGCKIGFRVCYVQMLDS
jgi:hypothetical protein